MNPVLLVLAAGMGSRYGGLKQIDPVGKNGETIIDYSIYDAVNSGFESVIFVIRKDIEKDFREIIGKKYESKINIEYVFQELTAIPDGFKIPAGRIKPWGTGHAILCAYKKINQPFAVINGDDFYGRNSFQILADYLGNNLDDSNSYAIIGYILEKTLSEFGYVSRGICTIGDSNFLQNIVEHTKIKKSAGKIYSIDEKGNEIELSSNEYVSMNMFGFTQSIFKHLEDQFLTFLSENINNIKSEFYIPTVVNNLVHSGMAKVRVLPTSSTWLGITYMEDKQFVVKSISDLIQAKEYPDKLWD